MEKKWTFGFIQGAHGYVPFVSHCSYAPQDGCFRTQIADRA